MTLTTTTRIEAYGAKGLRGTPWRKTFKSLEALEKWIEAQDGNAEVYGVREAE